MPRTVFITGVSSGIGRMTAELMAGSGWQVAATSRDPDALQEWAGEHQIFLVPLDVTNEADIQHATARVFAHFGSIDALVNNAGYGLFGPLEGTSAAEVEKLFRTNLFGVISLSRSVMPIMRQAGGGTIVNISSIGGRTASPFAALYHASKFALEGLSESLRFEASLHGIRVKLVEPAHFQTGFISRALQMIGHPAYDAPFTNYMKWVHHEDRKAPPPEPVALAILKAIEDPSPRLRYPVKGALMLALTRILPDKLWRSLLMEGMTRTPKEPKGG